MKGRWLGEFPAKELRLSSEFGEFSEEGKVTEVPRCGAYKRGWPPGAGVTRPVFHQGNQDSIEVFPRALKVFCFVCLFFERILQ